MTPVETFIDMRKNDDKIEGYGAGMLEELTGPVRSMRPSRVISGLNRPSSAIVLG